MGCRAVVATATEKMAHALATASGQPHKLLHVIAPPTTEGPTRAPISPEHAHYGIDADEIRAAESQAYFGQRDGVSFHEEPVPEENRGVREEWVREQNRPRRGADGGKQRKQHEHFLWTQLVCEVPDG